MSKLSKKSFDTFSPAVLLAICILAGVIVPIYPFMDELDGFSFFWPYDFEDKEWAVTRAVLAYLLGFVSFWLVFHFAKRPRAKPGRTYIINEHGGMWHLLRMSYATVALGALLTLIAIMGGLDSFLSAGGDRIQRFAGLNSLILVQNCLLGLSVAWFMVITRGRAPVDRKRLAPWLAFSLFALLVISLQGAKSTIFSFIVCLGAIWHYRRKRLSLFKMMGYGAVVFVLLMLYHIVKQELFVVGEVLSIGKEVGLLDSLYFFYVSFSGNLMQLQTMSILMEATPDKLEFQYGATLLMVVLLWVPSQLFPAKPLTAPGIFTVALWPDRWSEQNTTMPPGFFGEMYLNFGWAGIVLGGMFLGYLMGRSYRSIQQNVGCELSLGRHAMMISLVLFLFRGELAATILLFASFYIPFSILVKMSSGGRRS